MNKMKISNFQEYQTRFWNQHTLKKAGPEMFSFWINDIQAKKEALFDICGLMQKICWTENLLELLGFSYIVPRISIRLYIRHSC